MDAFLQLAVGEAGIIDPSVITYARIAELAGVSERTAYRFFPTKGDFERMLMERRLLASGRAIPEKAGDFAGYLDAVTRELAERVPQPVAVAGLGGMVEADRWAEYRGDRVARVEAAVAAVLPEGVEEGDRKAIAAVIRTLMSLRTVVATASEWGMTVDEAGAAHAWAVDLLVRTMQQGENTPWPSTRSC